MLVLHPISDLPYAVREYLEPEGIQIAKLAPGSHECQKFFQPPLER